MSEAAPESTAPRSSGGGALGTLQRKMGPLPIWGWMVVLLVIAGVYYFIKSSKGGSSSSTTTGAGTAAGATSVNSPGGVDSSLVPQFVNQVYNQETPPTVSLPSSINVNVGQQPVGTGTSGSSALTPLEGKSGGWTVQSIGGQNFGLWGSDGKYSLATIAKSHGVTPQQIISASTNYGGNNAAFQKYVSAGNFNAKLPTGVAIAIPVTGSGAANP